MHEDMSSVAMPHVLLRTILHPAQPTAQMKNFYNFYSLKWEEIECSMIFFAPRLTTLTWILNIQSVKIRRLQIVQDFRNCLDGGIIYARTKARRASKRSGLSFVAMPQVFQPVATKFSTSAARFSNASYNSRFSKKLSESSWIIFLCHSDNWIIPPLKWIFVSQVRKNKR